MTFSLRCWIVMSVRRNKNNSFSLVQCHRMASHNSFPVAFFMYSVHSLTTDITKGKHCRSDQRHNQKRNGSSRQCCYPLKGREVNNGIVVVTTQNNYNCVPYGRRDTENLKMIDCVCIAG